MSFIDKTGMPRSDNEIQEAIDVVKEVLIKHSTVLPMLTVHCGIIMDGLRELQTLRKLLRQAKERRELEASHE